MAYMNPTVIVWDLETVYDLGGFAAANDLSASEPPHGEADCWVVDAAFCDKIAALRPQLVTFSEVRPTGIGYRAMVNGIFGPELSARPYSGFDMAEYDEEWKSL
jgi:hypothetical protein